MVCYYTEIHTFLILALASSNLAIGPALILSILHPFGYAIHKTMSTVNNVNLTSSLPKYILILFYGQFSVPPVCSGERSRHSVLFKRKKVCVCHHYIQQMCPFYRGAGEGGVKISFLRLKKLPFIQSCKGLLPWISIQLQPVYYNGAVCFPWFWLFMERISLIRFPGWNQSSFQQ